MAETYSIGYIQDLMKEKLKTMEYNGEQFDFTIKVYRHQSITEFKVHSQLMAASSNYFNALLTNELLEAKQRFVKIEDIHESIVREVIDYCYTGLICLSDTGMEDMIECACMLGIDNLVELCLNKLLTYDIHRMDRFFEILTESEYFRQMDEKLLSAIISHDQLVVTSEDVILRAIIKWVSEDIKTRAKSIDTLLQHVRFASLGLERLLELKKEEVPFQSESFHGLIDKAISVQAVDFPLELIDDPDLMGKLKPRQKPKFKHGQWLFIIYGDSHVVKYDLFHDKSYNVPKRYWTVEAPFDCCIGGAIINDHLYLVNNHEDYFVIERYDILNNKWADLSTKLEGTSIGPYDPGNSVVAIDSKIYIGISDEWTLYDVETGESKRLTYDHRFHSPSTPYVTVKNEIFVLDCIERCEGDWQNFMPDGTWQCQSFMPYGMKLWSLSFCDSVSPKISPHSSARARGVIHEQVVEFGFLAYKDKLYVAGGLDALTGKGKNRKFRCYSLDLRSWFDLPDMNLKRGACQLVELDGLLVVIGGEKTNTSEVYNPTAREWTTLKLNIPNTAKRSFSDHLDKLFVKIIKYQRKNSTEDITDVFSEVSLSHQ